jgi:3-methylfumaryl-CoA hydratase
VFVKVRHAVRTNGAAEPALVEFRDIVYRAARQPGDAEATLARECERPPQRGRMGWPLTP